MQSSSFYTLLVLLSMVVAIALLGIHSLEAYKGFELLSWLSCLFFVSFSLIIFQFAKRSIQSEDKNKFSQLFMGATVVKMLISLLLVLVYFFVVKPENKYFILPFFFVYICYTIFEVYFMSKIGKG